MRAEAPDRVPAGARRLPPAAPAGARAPLPRAGAVHPALRLQRQAGNQAVGRLLQAKLTVSAPDDIHEQEADRVADAVMRQANPEVQAPLDLGEGHLQRCACGGSCSTCAGVDEDRHDLVQPLRVSSIAVTVARREASGPTGGDATLINGVPEAELQARIEGLRGSGQPLAPSVRTAFEPRFGRDFADVRVHTSPAAASLAQALDARAFTVGRDVFMSAGEYAPGTPAGQRLLAHELTHVVQQTGGGGRAPRPMTAQRDGFSALDVVEGVIDPKTLVGKAWLQLERPTKLRLVDTAIDGAVALIDVFPGQVQFGAFWVFVKEGLKGFYAGLRSATEDVKIAAMDKIATIMAGRDPAFALAYLKGLVKGFFLDGLLGIPLALYDLAKVLGKLWDFLKGIGEAIGRFPADIEALIERFVAIGKDLAENLGPALEELTSFLSDPAQTRSLIETIVEKGKTLAKDAGKAVAESLLNFLSQPGASAAIGDTAGRVGGMVLWEVLFAVLTAGGGAAATAAKTAVRTVTEAVGKLLGKVVSGVLKIVSELRALVTKAVKWVKDALQFLKGKLSELCGRFADLLDDVVEFFGRLLASCHESKLVCNFEAVVARLLKINKARAGALKELAGKIHMLRGVLKGQAIAVVEIRVAGEIRYVAATNAGAWGGWAPAQLKALKQLDIKALEPIGKELVHAEPTVLKYVDELRKGGEKVDVLRWGISAGETGSHICAACRTLQKGLGGFVEEFSALGKRY